MKKIHAETDKTPASMLQLAISRKKRTISGFSRPQRAFFAIIRLCFGGTKHTAATQEVAFSGLKTAFLGNGIPRDLPACIGFGEMVTIIRGDKMDNAKNNADFREKLFELMKDIDGVTTPNKDKIIRLTKKTKKGHDLLQTKLGNLQSSLDSLRLGLKYLIFDLEATRRENNDLRKRLDQNPPK
ncbi:MAG: hypothetical protein DRP56_10935 [Planctomycetota bacterium]|nr:MAG: hypothetical protein DRP56_10935 [Planctomycetota bacterium]